MRWNKSNFLATAAAAVTMGLGAGLVRADDTVSNVTQIQAAAPTPLYVSNKAPLAVSPLVKLPIGAIKPRGWVKHMLELEADGMTGHLPEVSTWCKFEGNAWTDPHGEGKNGWEEVPYWLKGFGDLGYVLNDQRIITETKRWIEAIITAQADDGWFGPSGLRTANDGKPDLWPHMAVLNALQNYYEYTTAQGQPDERIIKLMDRYFQWELKCPDADFMHGYWPEMRTGDNLESVYWLYNRTGESWLLDLATKIEKHTPRRWMTGVPMLHNVNLAQGFREPAEYWMQSHDEKYLKGTDHAYHTFMDVYGQVPGGGFGADENARPGFTDPRQGFETCGIVEFMHSFEMLTRITGDALWADRCEDVAFNDFPAALTPDLKSLHYLTSPNSVQLDQQNRHPDIDDSGTMVSYSPGGVYRCCQHNHGMGWPYYAEELVLATADQGLCVSLYSDCSATAKVNDDVEVTLDEKTGYPFDGAVNFALSWSETTPRAHTFPLYLRIPKWCDAPTVKINGIDTPVETKPDSFICINRAWKNGDTVSLNLPMHLSVRQWEKNKDSVSVDYGPLTFSLKIGEETRQYGTVNGWPEYALYATTPWNYGLVLDPVDPTKGMEILKKTGTVPEQPWTTGDVPIEIHAKAAKIPNWQMDKFNMVGLLQQSPVKTDEPVETVTLIPMGAARLRISQFPVIGSGADAHDWTPTSTMPYTATASHVNDSDTTDALQDGILPQNSADPTIPRFTWWDHRGTNEWVQYDFKKPKAVTSCDVYWFDDEPNNGHCAPPTSWQVQYKSGDDWKPVENASEYGVATDKFNHVTFTSVTTTALRITVQLQDSKSAGILEWKVN